MHLQFQRPLYKRHKEERSLKVYKSHKRHKRRRWWLNHMRRLERGSVGRGGRLVSGG